MRLTQLIEELAGKFDSDSMAGEEVAAAAARTALVAQLTALESARAGTVGRGLQLAAEELQELALLTASQDKNIRQLGESAKLTIAEVRHLFNGLSTARWENPEQLREELLVVQDSIALMLSGLVRKISAMPQSIADYEAPQSADRVQIETLLRQAMINGRDRLTAMQLIVEALVTFSHGVVDVEQLLNLDTDALDYNTRQRLAGLTRDQRLDESIITSKTAH